MHCGIPSWAFYDVISFYNDGIPSNCTRALTRDGSTDECASWEAVFVGYFLLRSFRLVWIRKVPLSLFQRSPPHPSSHPAVGLGGAASGVLGSAAGGAVRPAKASLGL